MFYTKSPLKTARKQEEIQPWNAEESNMLHLIIESNEIHPKLSRKIIKNSHQQEKVDTNTTNKESHSFNFNSNLRKYEKKKAEEFNLKKEVNFIQKNIKGVSEDYMYFNQNVPIGLSNKNLQQKQKKIKNWELEYNSTIEPINWSLIMYYEESRSERKHRHKDIQSFLRFQSQRPEKSSLKKQSNDLKVDNIEENKYQGNKYQKLLKLREGLRKRNLKSASQSRKVIDNSLTIEEGSKASKLNSQKKYESLNKTLQRIIPKTSQSQRNTDTIIIIENSPPNSPKKAEEFVPRITYTSHKNRVKSPTKKTIEKKSIV